MNITLVICITTIDNHAAVHANGHVHFNYVHKLRPIQKYASPLTSFQRQTKKVVFQFNNSRIRRQVQIEVVLKIRVDLGYLRGLPL